MEVNHFISKGKKIVYYEWNEIEGEAKGIIQISHGMVEHATRYQHIAEFFNKNGYIVVADDHRGHGNTDKYTLGFCNGDMANDTVFDMFSLLLLTQKKYKKLPYFVFGFSYGSFLTQKFLEKYSHLINGVILGGSCKNSKLLVKIGKWVSKINVLLNRKTKPAKFIKKLTFDMYDNKFKDKCFLSANESSNQHYKKDNYCSFICSYNFYNSFFTMLDSLYTKQYAKNLNKELKMLIVSGSDDPVGCMGKGVVKLFNYYKKSHMNNVEIKLYPNARHEFFNEVEGHKYLEDILDFCDRTVEALQNKKTDI